MGSEGNRTNAIITYNQSVPIPQGGIRMVAQNWICTCCRGGYIKEVITGITSLQGEFRLKGSSKWSETVVEALW